MSCGRAATRAPGAVEHQLSEPRPPESVFGRRSSGAGFMAEGSTSTGGVLPARLQQTATKFSARTPPGRQQPLLRFMVLHIGHCSSHTLYYYNIQIIILSIFAGMSLAEEADAALVGAVVEIVEKS